jgi:hypothetical protein
VIRLGPALIECQWEQVEEASAQVAKLDHNSRQDIWPIERRVKVGFGVHHSRVKVRSEFGKNSCRDTTQGVGRNKSRFSGVRLGKFARGSFCGVRLRKLFVPRVDRLPDRSSILPIRTTPATTFCTISFGSGKGLLGDSYAKLPV